LLVFDCPGASAPKFNDGHSVCEGCGFELISCDFESLFVSVTDCPTVIDTLFGLTPAPVIVIVAPTGPGPELDPPPPPPLGAVGDEPPQAAITPATITAVIVPKIALVVIAPS
jgi:hypothetical protein